MEIKIIFTQKALRNIADLNRYLEKKWNIKVAIEFQLILMQKLLLIKANPNIGSATEKGSVRKILITKHNRLYYRILNEGEISIIELFDTRQSPDKSKYE